MGILFETSQFLNTRECIQDLRQTPIGTPIIGSSTSGEEFGNALRNHNVGIEETTFSPQHSCPQKSSANPCFPLPRFIQNKKMFHQVSRLLADMNK
ncbi:MAG TPA: hypothetical protein DD706_03930 [Nitrospiraceae bacterium]|nr:hypothetical protein [Nitrospiraceae bacterium]